MEVAREYHKEQLQYRLAIGSQWEGANFIFIQASGKQLYPDTPSKVFSKLIRRHNSNTTDESQKLPEIPLHGLRHTSATLLISQSVDIKIVQNRLGHSQASTTMDIYSHALQKMDEKAADVLDNLLDKKA